MSRCATISIFLLSIRAAALPGEWLSMGLVATPAEVPECGAEELRIAIRVQNPAAAGIAGLEAFVRYPAELFQPVSYVEGDLKGFAAFNGPPLIGEGFPGCGPAAADPWDDGAGEDVVSVAASAFSVSGSTGAVTEPEATLGWFTFRLRPDVVLPAAPVEFALEFDPCDPGVYCRNTLYDAAGLALDALYSPPAVEVRIRKGIRVKGFSCRENLDGPGMFLEWIPPDGVFDGVNIYRNGELLFSRVPPQVRDVTDAGAAEGSAYEIAVIVRGREEPCRAACGSREPAFIRGDVDLDGKFTLTDAMKVLLHLYQGGQLPCLDAGDFDDSGTLDLSDPIGILGFLFQGGAFPSPPYPESGPDPTADPLDCAPERG